MLQRRANPTDHLKHIDWVFIYAGLGGLIALFWLAVHLMGQDPFLVDLMLAPSLLAVLGLAWRERKSVYFLAIGITGISTLLVGLGLHNLSALDCGDECLRPAASTFEFIAYGLVWIVLPMLLPFMVTKYVPIINMQKPRQKPSFAQRLLLVNVAFDIIAALGIGALTSIVAVLVLAFGSPAYFVFTLLTLIPLGDAIILQRLTKKPLTTRTSTYFSLSRIILATATAWWYWYYFTYNSVINDDNNGLAYLFLIVLWLLFFDFCAVVLYRATKAAWQLWTLLAVTVVLALAMASLAVLANSAATFGPFGIRHDNQVANDLDSLAQDVRDQFSSDGRLPADLGQATSALGTGDPLVSRLSRYRYLPDNQTNQFQLCATFTFATAPNNSQDGDTSQHKAGYQCFVYNNQ